MREILNQEEIDALFSAAQQGPKGASAAAKKNVVPCDLRRSGLPASDQLGVLTALHDSESPSPSTCASRSKSIWSPPNS